MYECVAQTTSIDEDDDDAGYYGGGNGNGNGDYDPHLSGWQRGTE